MPNHQPAAIANAFLSKRGSSSWPSQMYLQKLVNAANGWNLAINSLPLVNENPEAWDNGPVFRTLWNHIRDFGYRGENCELVDSVTGAPYVAELSTSEQAIIDHVWRKYGRHTASRLSDMTHEPGTPWYIAYFGRGRNSEIDAADISEHYTKLAKAGRD